MDACRQTCGVGDAKIRFSCRPLLAPRSGSAISIKSSKRLGFTSPGRAFENDPNRLTLFRKPGTCIYERKIHVEYVSGATITERAVDFACRIPAHLPIFRKVNTKTLERSYRIQAVIMIGFSGKPCMTEPSYRSLFRDNPARTRFRAGMEGHEFDRCFILNGSSGWLANMVSIRKNTCE